MADAVVAVALGNTRARWGLLRGREVERSGAAGADDPGRVCDELAEALALSGTPDRVVLASVNAAAAGTLARHLRDRVGEVEWAGRDLMPPMKHALDDASTLGIDRVLTAFAAWRRLRQACIVIDAGTAITVNFVDGEGTFQGGSIAPGLRMMMRALHEHTDALPDAEFDAPSAAQGPFGRNTVDAMRLGVLAAARGAARECIDRYAENYGAYPRIVATGGDAPLLFEGDGLIEDIIPDLQLLGIAEMLEALDEDTNEPDDGFDAVR